MVVAGKYVRIFVSPNLVAFSCIWILYGGLDAWPINTEIPGMTLLFGWVSAPQTHCGLSNINFDIFGFFWGADPINISWKIANGRQSSFSLGVYIKGIVQAFNWLMCLGGFLHLKPTAGCQISTLIFGFFWGVDLWKIANGRQSSFSLGV